MGFIGFADTPGTSCFEEGVLMWESHMHTDRQPIHRGHSRHSDTQTSRRSHSLASTSRYEHTHTFTSLGAAIASGYAATTSRSSQASLIVCLLLRLCLLSHHHEPTSMAHPDGMVWSQRALVCSLARSRWRGRPSPRLLSCRSVRLARLSRSLLACDGYTFVLASC